MLGQAAVPVQNGQSISLDHPVRPRPRYGYDAPPHAQLAELISSGEDRYRATLESFLPLRDHLKDIPLGTDDPATPCWHNKWYAGLDAVALYGLLATTRPARYYEVGSGMSTKFARRAIADHDLPTRIVSLDPQPRAEIDALCDKVIRKPLEDVDLALFDELEAGDVCFIDGSHRVFMNSDVTVVFTELIPRLKPGVLLHVHDIYLPWDYPPQIVDWYYSEQYVLAAWLLAEGPLEVVLPNFHISTVGEVYHVLDPIWDLLIWSSAPASGVGFWMRKT